MRYSLYSLFFALSAVAGCAGQNAQTCLQTPVSATVPERSVGVCKSAVKGDPARLDVYQRTMDLLLARGDYAAMVDLSSDVLSHDDTRTDALYYLAVGHRKLDNCDEALRRYQAYAERNENDPNPYFGMGMCFEQQGNGAQAVRAYELYLDRADRKLQGDWIARAQARIAVLQGKAPVAATDKGLPLGKQGGVAARPAHTPPPGAANRPPLKRVVRKPKVAAKPPKPAPKPAPPPKPVPPPKPKVQDCTPFAKAIKDNPFDTKAYENLAECKLASKKYREVERSMRVAIRDNPDWPRGWYHIGRAYTALKKTGQAKRAYGKACKQGVTEACGK